MNIIVQCDAHATCLKDCIAKVPVDPYTVEPNSLLNDPGSCYHNDHSDGQYREASVIPSEWLPIKSAPKDGTPILCYAPAFDGLPELISKTSYHKDAGFCICELRTVTHWKPIHNCID